MKSSTLEEPLIYLNIWIRNDDIMNEEDDEARSLTQEELGQGQEDHC